MIDPKAKEKILAANLSNIVRKVKAGKPLTSSELKLVSGESEPAEQKWARNQVDLAAALGVDRRTIHRWGQLQDNPGHASDGRYDIAAWRTFAAKAGLKGGDFDTEDISVIKTRRELVKLHDDEFDLAVKKRDYIPRSEIKQVLAQFIHAAKALSFSGVNRRVILIRSAADTAAAAEVERAEMEAIWKDLEGCKWAKEETKQ